MITRLVITDLTRMYRGKVCIAGYNKERQCIRPVLPPPGIPESTLYRNGAAAVFPFALVDMDLIEPRSEPPHTEDVLYDPDSLSHIRIIQGREEVLDWSICNSVGDIFGQPIRKGPGHYVMDCQGSRSLGTIQPYQVVEAIYEPGEEDTWDYRLAFLDQKKQSYRLKITDLTWHYYCDSQRSGQNTPQQIVSQLTQKLQSSKIYLRIGLARGWKKFPNRCYLQITGVYSFPDYLEGKTFADLTPKRKYQIKE